MKKLTAVFFAGCFLLFTASAAWAPCGLEGFVYCDVNLNGVFDEGIDEPFADVGILVDGVLGTTTNAEGFYYISTHEICYAETISLDESTLPDDAEFINPPTNGVTYIRFMVQNWGIDSEICHPSEESGCRFTGGGVDTDGNWDHTLEYGEMIRNGAGNLPEGIDRATFGGQAGASTALPPQPKGEWTHHNQKGPSGRFTFHGGTASAPMGTEIDEIRCSDPGGCKPSGNPPSPVKQLDFDGIGTFKSIGKGSNAPVFENPTPIVTAEGHGNQTFDGTFHWFEVNIDDLGEPGGNNTGTVGIECPDNAFGEKGDEELADCVCPDFYRITIYNGVNYDEVVWLGDGIIDPTNLRAQEVLYEFYGYIDGGNLQIHNLTGGDR